MPMHNVWAKLVDAFICASLAKTIGFNLIMLVLDPFFLKKTLM